MLLRRKKRERGSFYLFLVFFSVAKKKQDGSRDKEYEGLFLRSLSFTKGFVKTKFIFLVSFKINLKFPFKIKKISR